MSKSIGTVGFRPRETWQPRTFYRADDWIFRDRSARYCLEDHESGDVFDESKWGYLTDGRGISEAIDTASSKAAEAAEAAQEATEKAALAEEQAQEARQAAAAANAEAEAAQEATRIFTENFKQVFSDEFAYAIVDLNGTLLWGIRHDGTVFQPKGIPEDTKKRLAELDGYQIVESPQYLFAIVDKNGTLLYAIDRKGGSFVNSINGVCTIEQFESKEYIFAVMDSADNLLFGINRRTGAFQASKFGLPPEILRQIHAASAGSTEIDGSDSEFIYKIVDADGMIVFAVRWDGTIYAPKGIPEEQKKENRRLDKRISALEKGLANFQGGTGDWSGLTSVHLPRPTVPARIEITGEVPTGKFIAVGGTLKYNDMTGNAFTKPILWNVQGNISTGFDKKNFAIDLLNSNDGDDSFEVKFGDWVPQDSFHLKAHISDFWKIRSLGVYRHAEEIARSRPYFKRRPWDIISKGAKQTRDEVLQGGIGKVTEDIDTGALGRPDGFPVMLYINGTPWGLYTLNLKKHKDNYRITKNDNDGLQLFFGDHMTGVFNHCNDTYWVISNHDLRRLEGNGSSRSINIPSYTSGSGAQLVMESAGAAGMTLDITNSGKTYSYPVRYNGEPVTAQNTWEGGDCVTVKRAGTSDAYYFDVTPLCKKWDDKRGYAVNEYVYDEDTIDFEANGRTATITIRRLFRLSNTAVGFAGYEYDDEGYPCTLLYRTNADGEQETYRSGRITLYRTMRPSYINWRALEVRNPKKTICVAHDGLDRNGKPKLKFEYYDYDSPNDYAQTGYYERTHEIISEEIIKQSDITRLKGTGETGEFSKKEYTRSCNTRKTLETYSFVGPIMDMTIPQGCLDAWGFATEAEAKKAIFAEHHDTDHNIDFFLVYNDMSYRDGITHNTLYTMYDGKRLFANLYDTDISMGMGATYDNSFPPVETYVLAAGHTFVSYLWKYFADEIKARWGELRSMGVISPERFEAMVWGMVNEVGAAAYAEEARLWSQPAYREPVYWRMDCGAIQVLEDGDGLPYHGYDESANKEMEGRPDWAEGIQVALNEVYNHDGHSYTCTVAHTTSAATRPDKAYTCGFPSSGGVKDSPRRIIEWFRERVAALDAAFGYVAPVNLSEAVAINEATIEAIINK